MNEKFYVRFYARFLSVPISVSYELLQAYTNLKFLSKL